MIVDGYWNSCFHLFFSSVRLQPTSKKEMLPPPPPVSEGYLFIFSLFLSSLNFFLFSLLCLLLYHSLFFIQRRKIQFLLTALMPVFLFLLLQFYPFCWRWWTQLLHVSLHCLMVFNESISIYSLMCSGKTQNPYDGRIQSVITLSYVSSEISPSDGA